MVLLIFHYINSWKAKNFFSNSAKGLHLLTLWDEENNTYANINFDALISDYKKKGCSGSLY